MAGNHFCVCAVALASMTLVSGSGTIKWALRTLDIRKFLCTTERIWTYNTSTTAYVRCQVDKARNIANTSLLFRRSYFHDEQQHWTVKNLQGIFPKGQRDIMQVRPPGEEFIAKEKLLYMSRKYGCGVIMVTQTRRARSPSFDLRIWDRFVKQGPNEKCVKHFVKHTKTGKVIYGRMCENILHIK